MGRINHHVINDSVGVFQSLAQSWTDVRTALQYKTYSVIYETKTEAVFHPTIASYVI